MIKVYEGDLIAKGKKFGIVVARFNEFITKQLLKGAIDCLKRHGVDEDDISVAWVPGSFEVPNVADLMAKSRKYSAVICLGVVVKGETMHHEFIAGQSARGIAQAGMSTGEPVIYGIVTADSLEQAIERAGTKAGNRGWSAALAAIEMSCLYDKLKK